MPMKDDHPAHLRQILSPVTDVTDADGDLPSLTSDEYQPFARAANKPLFSVHFLTAKGEMRSFQYLHLDSGSTFTGDAIAIRFLGMQPINVRVTGRNLRRLYDYLHQHRVSWVLAVAPGRDFAKDGQPVITAIEFSEERLAL